MAIRRIVQIDEDNPVLRDKARPIKSVNRRIRKLLDDMVETMRDANGVGLAGPQVGMGQRLLVMEVPVDIEDPEAGTIVYRVVNPLILAESEETEEGQEACLSIPSLHGDVPRNLAVDVQYTNEKGEEIEERMEGFLARVFQHELDHLDGILFTDRVTGVDKLYLLKEDEDGEMIRVPYELILKAQEDAKAEAVSDS